MKKRASGEEDRISSLPDNVRVHILKFLTVPDAVKTSVLSTKWRNVWTDLPSLHLDSSFRRMDHGHGYNSLENAVNEVMLNFCRVLFFHRGPLVEFTLTNRIFTYFPDQINQILLFLQSKRVESLTMRTSVSRHGESDYKLPRRLLTASSFSQLKTLRLAGCQFTSSPVSFEGFRMLTVLELKEVIFNDSSSSPWSFRCPLLECLTLDSCCDIQQKRYSYFRESQERYSNSIVIEAPKLNCFVFVGGFQSLHLKLTALLKKATIHKRCPRLECKIDESHLLKIWDGLAAVESLTVADHFYQYMAIGDEEISQRPWEMLREITLNEVRMCRRSNVWSLLIMITNSPNLQRLTINMSQPHDNFDGPMSEFYGGAVDASEFRDKAEYPGGVTKYELGRLKRVKMTKVVGTENEMAFIRWLLNSSPTLVEMDIKLFTELSDSRKLCVLQKLIGFDRRSLGTRIIVN